MSWDANKFCIKNSVTITVCNDLKNDNHLHFQIPVDESAGWKATGWNLNKPDWTGKLKVVSKGTNLSIKFEDRGSMKPYAIVSLI